MLFYSLCLKKALSQCKPCNGTRWIISNQFRADSGLQCRLSNLGSPPPLASLPCAAKHQPEQRIKSWDFFKAQTWLLEIVKWRVEWVVLLWPSLSLSSSSSAAPVSVFLLIMNSSRWTIIYRFKEQNHQDHDSDHDYDHDNHRLSHLSTKQELTLQGIIVKLKNHIHDDQWSMINWSWWSYWW